MKGRVTPMIHVPDVAAAIAWYEGVGFSLVGKHEESGVVDWALLSFGDSAVMFNAGGKTSAEDRRDVDLYVDVPDVEEVYRRLEHRVQLREELHDTFYGHREFIVRDLNGFWVTFGQSTTQAHS